MRETSNFLIQVERKDLGITHQDFRRIFPRVCKDWGAARPLLVEEGDFKTDFDPSIILSVVNDAKEKEIVVIVSEERVRAVGKLTFPYLEVMFWFSGFEETESIIFMRRFDTAFQKGGG